MGDRQGGKMPGTQDSTDRPSELERTTTDTDFLSAAQTFKEQYKDKIKVMICEPSIGNVDYIAHEACWDLAMDLARYEQESNYKFFKTGIGRYMVAYSREKFCEIALQFDFDYILFLDDDHYWQKDMFRVLQKHIKDYDIVTPLCVTRLKPYFPVVYKCNIFTKDGQQYIENKIYTDIKEIKKGDLITDADAVGFGCAIVKVELLKKIKQPWFFSMSPIGEDLLFCIKAKKEANVKILVDTNVEAPHLKDRELVDWRDYVREKNIGSNAKS